MAHLVKINKKDPARSMYGFYQNNAININIGLLWKENHTVNGFIKDFVNTYVHETVHSLIRDERKRKIYKDKALNISDVGEEYLVVCLEENSKIGSLNDFKNKQGYGRYYSSKPQNFYLKP